MRVGSESRERGLRIRREYEGRESDENERVRRMREGSIYQWQRVRKKRER